MSVVIAFAIGFTAVSLLWPQVERTSPALLPFRIFLGLGVGQGLTACLAFVYLVVRGRLDRSYVLAEVLVLLALTGLFALATTTQCRENVPLPAAAVEAASPGYEWLLAAVLLRRHGGRICGSRDRDGQESARGLGCMGDLQPSRTLDLSSADSTGATVFPRCWIKAIPTIRRCSRWTSSGPGSMREANRWWRRELIGGVFVGGYDRARSLGDRRVARAPPGVHRGHRAARQCVPAPAFELAIRRRAADVLLRSGRRAAGAPRRVGPRRGHRSLDAGRSCGRIGGMDEERRACYSLSRWRSRTSQSWLAAADCANMPDN